MRPYLLLPLMGVFMTLTACAEPSSHADNGIVCKRATPLDSTTISAATMDELLRIIESTLRTKYHYTLLAADVNNMEACKIHKRREIRYNPAFVQYVLQSTHDKWGLVFLLAHEMGHHELGHTSKKIGSHPSVELEADEFAGALLQRMGASLSEAQEVMLFISSSLATKTHPGRPDRLIAIQTGWEQEKENQLRSIDYAVHRRQQKN